MTSPDETLMAQVEPQAKEIKRLDDELSILNSKVKSLKSEREALSNGLVCILRAAGIQTSIGLNGGGMVRLDVKTYVSIMNQDELIGWAENTKMNLPSMQFNASTLSAWYMEQLNNNLPVPPDTAVKAFNKTRAKVNG